MLSSNSKSSFLAKNIIYKCLQALIAFVDEKVKYNLKKTSFFLRVVLLKASYIKIKLFSSIIYIVQCVCLKKNDYEKGK